VSRVQNWILVTGTPRSGTTFVGKVLSLPLEVDYIHEPFSPRCGIPDVDVRYVYTRAGLPNEPRVREWVRLIKTYQLELRTVIRPTETLVRRLGKRVLGGRGENYLRLARLNPFHRAAVVKDPIGCLLTGYLMREHGFRAVVLIRHPAAFVASVLRLGWDPKFDLAGMGQQQALIEDHFANEPDVFARAPTSRLEAAAAVWRLLNKALLAQAEESGAVVVRHEDLSRAPVATFRALYNQLGLIWTDRLERRTLALTRPGNRIEPRKGHVQDFERDSARLLEHRLGQLSADDRVRIWEITRDVAERFYTEAGKDNTVARDGLAVERSV